MTLIKISINDNGEHWGKKISLFGICVYHRHDFTKEPEKRAVGFDTAASVSCDVEDYDDWEDRE